MRYDRHILYCSKLYFRIERKFQIERFYLRGDSHLNTLIRWLFYNRRYHLGNFGHLFLFHTSRGYRWGTNSDTGCNKGTLRLKRDRVFIDSDANFIERFLGIFTSNALIG